MTIDKEGTLLGIPSEETSEIVIPPYITNIAPDALWEIKHSTTFCFKGEFNPNMISALCNPWKFGKLTFQEKIGASLETSNAIEITVIVKGISYKYEYLNSDTIKLVKEHNIYPNLQIIEEHRFSQKYRNENNSIQYRLLFSVSEKDPEFKILPSEGQSNLKYAISNFYEHCQKYFDRQAEKASLSEQISLRTEMKTQLYFSARIKTEGAAEPEQKTKPKIEELISAKTQKIDSDALAAFANLQYKKMGNLPRTWVIKNNVREN